MNTLTLPKEGRGSFRVEYQGIPIDRMIVDFMEKESIPGMTLAIVQAPYIPRIVGYGVSNVQTGQLASAKTIWPAAQISQAFNAVAVMQLFERGLLKLESPVSQWLDGLPQAWRPVSVFQLLQHGVGDCRLSGQFRVRSRESV